MSFSPFAVSRIIAAQFDGCHELEERAQTSLHTAAHEGNVKGLRGILKTHSGEAIDQRNYWGCTPLRLAATGGHSDCALLLLNHGATTDLSDVKGQTPLHIAIKNAHYGVARLLLERGANPNGDADNRCTPLAVAVMQGNIEFVELLLNFNAEVVTYRTGATGQYFRVNTAQMAVCYQHYDCLKLLLEAEGNSVSVDSATHSSFTGVHSLYHTVVVQRCSQKFAELLYEFGVALWVKNDQGRFPWEMEPQRVDWDCENHRSLMDYFHKIKAEPRTLKSSCRLSVLKQLWSVNKGASSVKFLRGVPQSLIHYLAFKNI